MASRLPEPFLRGSYPRRDRCNSNRNLDAGHDKLTVFQVLALSYVNSPCLLQRIYGFCTVHVVLTLYVTYVTGMARLHIYSNRGALEVA